MNPEPILLYTLVESPLGELLLLAREESLAGLYFTDQPHMPQIRNEWIRQNNAPIFLETMKQVREYVAGRLEYFDLPLLFVGTPFQIRVWQEIIDIPFGQTANYDELAVKIGEPDSARAVGSAAGATPACWIVPCHRVIAPGGRNSGYPGGPLRKEALLNFEAARAAGRESIFDWDATIGLP